MNKEIWRDIPNYEGLYQASTWGRIKSLKYWSGVHKKYYIRELILSAGKNSTGYLYVSLHKDGKKKMFKVHQLIAMTFLSSDENKPYINHINGIKTDNRLENLEYCTPSENVKHAYRTGLKHNSRKINQYDLEGKFIKTWNSSREIERELNINHSNLLKCCNNIYKQSKGYIWKYKD